MSYCDSIPSEILLLGLLASALVMLTMITTRILRRTGLFQKKTDVSLALMISVAATVEAAHILLIPNSSPEGNPMRGVTVNYYMLLIVMAAWTIGLWGLLGIEATITPTKTGEAPAEKPDLAVVKSKAPEGPKKKEKPAEKPSREAAKATGEMAKKVESHS